MIKNSLEGRIATEKRRNKGDSISYVVHAIASVIIGVIAKELRGFFVSIILMEEKKELMRSHITQPTIACCQKRS